MKLECPAARRGVRRLHLPVSARQNLPARQPIAGPDQFGSARIDPRVQQPDEREAGVPAGRYARLHAQPVVLLHPERLESLDAAPHHRMVRFVAQLLQRHQRIDPRRLDAAPAAVGLLMGYDPLFRLAHRPPPRGQRQSLKLLEDCVAGVEQRLPSEQPLRSLQRVVNLIAGHTV